MIGLNPKATFEVTIDEDVASDPTGHTVFIAHGWNVAQESIVRSAFARAEESAALLPELDGVSKERMQAKLGELRYASLIEVIRQSLCGWRRFNDADNKPIPFESNHDGTASDDSIASIPLWARMQLAAKLLDRIGIKTETVGKSVPSQEGATAT